MQTSHNVMWYAHCLSCFFLSSGVHNWPGKVNMYFCEHRDRLVQLLLAKALCLQHTFQQCSCIPIGTGEHCNPVIYLMHIICKENQYHKFFTKIELCIWQSDLQFLCNCVCGIFVTSAVIQTQLTNPYRMCTVPTNIFTPITYQINLILITGF